MPRTARVAPGDTTSTKLHPRDSLRQYGMGQRHRKKTGARGNDAKARKTEATIKRDLSPFLPQDTFCLIAAALTTMSEDKPRKCVRLETTCEVVSVVQGGAGSPQIAHRTVCRPGLYCVELKSRTRNGHRGQRRESLDRQLVLETTPPM